MEDLPNKTTMDLWTYHVFLYRQTLSRCFPTPSSEEVPRPVNAPIRQSPVATPPEDLIAKLRKRVEEEKREFRKLSRTQHVALEYREEVIQPTVATNDPEHQEVSLIDETEVDTSSTSKNSRKNKQKNKNKKSKVDAVKPVVVVVGNDVLVNGEVMPYQQSMVRGFLETNRSAEEQRKRDINNKASRASRARAKLGITRSYVRRK